MRIIKNTNELTNLTSPQSPKSLGFVPTMGALHDGHLRLVSASQQQCDNTVVSIFVNPLQFGPKEDFQTYPRPIEQDIAMLEGLKVDFLFLPEHQQLYPEGFATLVQEQQLSSELCGRFRPGFFTGVATIVAKLFNLIQPTQAFFGQKDLQQYKIIERLIRDLNFPLSLHMVPTVREADGLAMSSRNRYLSREQRQLAPELYACLKTMHQQIQRGAQNIAQLENDGKKMLAASGAFQLQYLEIRRLSDLSRLTSISQADNELAILVAALLGETRLIDNLLVKVP